MSLDRPKNKWFSELLTPDLILCSSIIAAPHSSKTPYQAVEIIQTGSFGWCFVLDGKVQSSDADEFIYHEALVHLPMLTHPDPKTVFIAGGGEGAVAREVLRHATVESLEMVDIDEDAVRVCREYLPARSQGAFDDSRLRLHFNDAVRFLKSTSVKYDVAIFDLADPVEDGPAYLLYTQDFYRLALQHLNPNGVAVVQAGNCNAILHREVFTAIYNTMRTVFPMVYSYSASIPSFGGMWGFVVGSMGPDPRALDAQTIERRLVERVTSPLAFYDGITHEGMLNLPKYLRVAMEEETRIISEKNPLFVY